MNKIDDEACPQIEQVLSQTPDDFGITLSGNPISENAIKQIHTSVRNLHRSRVQEIRQTDLNTNSQIQELEDI